jgi:DNA-binding ferritin-like protein
MTTTEFKSRPHTSKSALSDLSETGVKEISTDLRKLLADVFALYVKTKNFQDNDNPSLTPEAMLTDLLANDQELIKYLRATHDVCDRHNDVATASLIENWIDETENRAWFLYEILHRA